MARQYKHPKIIEQRIQLPDYDGPIRQLLITEGTVKIHLHNIYQKLSLNGRFALSLYARDRNLVNNILAQVLALLGALSGS